MSARKLPKAGAEVEPVTRVPLKRILPAIAETLRDLLFPKRRFQTRGRSLGLALSAAADRLAELAPPTRTLTHRKRELPYRLPPSWSIAEPGTPLVLASLDPRKRYLWILDEQLRFVYAPEKQVERARKFNHGDLNPGPDGDSRGIACAGGELHARRLPDDRPKWVIDLSASHSFNRMDLKVLGPDTLAAVIEHLAAIGSDLTHLEPGENVYDPLFRLAGFGHLIKYYLGVGAPRQG
jgi:hypothetical protein